MKDLFIKIETVVISDKIQFFSPVIKTVYNKTESISSFRAKVWDLLPSILKEINQLETLKKQLKNVKL